ncbi:MULTISPECIES: alpha/beta fold hydrolase [Brevibacterium]|uniref:alpha/beta fold hydrolase n=1 Tax=Brevibacterium TaxID=1696 RepID=UPI000DE952EA|nr:MULTISPECIES: alpha/beta fold hydrolase [Brevibacterium]
MSEIATRQIGEAGPRIVFVHGLFGRGKNFTSIAKSLEPEYSSLLLDLPNHGESAWTDTFDYIELADSVAATIAEVTAADDRPVHLVGHSLGGKVAMVLALRHPELVDRLVVVDIAPTSGRASGEFEHLLSSLAALDLGAIGSRGEADEALRGPIPSDRVRGFLLQNLRTTPEGYAWQPNLDLLRDSLPVIGSFPTTEEIGAEPFDHPVLWMAGERSDYVAKDDLPAMRALFPRTTLLTVKDAGHWVHSEAPQTFVSALRIFLGRD